MTPEQFRGIVGGYRPAVEHPSGPITLTATVETIRDAEGLPVYERAGIRASRGGLERTLAFPDPLEILPVWAAGMMCATAVENLTRNEEAFS